MQIVYVLTNSLHEEQEIHTFLKLKNINPFHNGYLMATVGLLVKYKTCYNG